MFLTITPDPVLDRIFFIDEWKPGLPMNALETATSVGGKGLDISVALRHLGEVTEGLCFLAGETGEQLLTKIEAYGILAHPVWVSGETRTAHIIAEKLHARHSHVFSGGIQINPHQLEQFFDQFRQRILNARWMLTGGIFPESVPSHFFAAITKIAHHAGVPVLIDSHSKYIQSALHEGVEIIKMNHTEFEWSFNQNISDIHQLIEAGQKVYAQYKPNALVITCGADGIIGFTAEGIFQARPPTLQVINAAGAGDAASAAIAWRQSLGDTWQETLRWSAAISAAVVLTTGTADLNMTDVDELLPKISIEYLGAMS
jgi:1-phosphofructokinase family hexose kinase